MCTQPRIIAPNVFYEVTSKGVDGLNAFPEDMREFFLKELSISLKKFAIKCFSWSIMDDHYHLIIKASDLTLSKCMQRFNSVYAKKFNKIKKRSGVLFQRRFSSVAIQEHNDLENSIRQIHLNPVRYGNCTLDELDRYKWSGHQAMVNKQSDGILDVEGVLCIFEDSNPRLDYYDFIKSKDLNSKDKEVINKIRSANQGRYSSANSDSWAIGDQEFRMRVLELHNSNRVRIAKHVRESVSIDSLLEKICICINVDRKAMCNQGRLNEISTARQLFAIIGFCVFEFTCTKLAGSLGVTASAVSRMISRGNRITGLDLLKEMVCCD